MNLIRLPSVSERQAVSARNWGERRPTGCQPVNAIVRAELPRAVRVHGRGGFVLAHLHTHRVRGRGTIRVTFPSGRWFQGAGTFMDDSQCLAEYVERGSQDAFALLVSRHVDLVYSAALRQLKDRDLAEDVTQAAFIALARKAKSLRREVAFSAWLLLTTRFLAINAMKAQSRRNRHEREAAQMAKTTEQPADVSEWEAISPHLDAALANLNKQDRRAITLRYFEGRALTEVAKAMGVSPAAARQRVHRAIARMRRFFAAHGVNVTAAALPPAILGHAVHSAPPGLVGAATSAGLAAKSAAAVLAETKGAVLVMASTKAKVLTSTAAFLLLSGGAVVGWKAIAPARSHTVVIGPQQHAAGVEALPWQKRFNEVYGLADGQILKQVQPPMIPERQIYWDEACKGHGWKLSAETSFIIQWNGQSPHWTTISLVESDLRMVLHDGLRLQVWQIDSSIPQDLKFPGDWVIREGASPQQAMDALALILSERLGRPTRFDLRRVTREAIVARGTYHFVPLPNRSNDEVIQLIDGKRQVPILLDGPATLTDLLRRVETYTNRKVFDETASTSARITVGEPQAHQLEDAVVRNIAAQTSLRFDREPREMDVWFMAEDRTTTTSAAPPR